MVSIVQCYVFNDGRGVKFVVNGIQCVFSLLLRYYRGRWRLAVGDVNLRSSEDISDIYGGDLI